MRRIEGDNEITKLLDDGAKAAAGKATLEKRMANLETGFTHLQNQMQEQVTMLRYALGNVLKTLNTYPAVKDQLEMVDYRTLAIMRAVQELHPYTSEGTLDFAALVEKHARAVRVDTFNELSAKDDENHKYIVSDSEEITENHLVIISSECKEDEQLGIFRSKMDVGGQELADIKDSFLGKKAGDTFDATIQGKTHSVTIHSTRKKPDATPTATN